MLQPSPIWLYHITHIDNLPSIIESGLVAKNNIKNHIVDIAHHSLQASRHKYAIPIKKGHVIHDYVPFYFAPRSPMLYAINKGAVPQYKGKQNEIIYLLCPFPLIQARNLDWLFTDGHFTQRLTQFFDKEEDFHHIDWQLMQGKYWHDINEDNDRRRRRQAEFLVHHSLAWSLIGGIAVYNKDMKLAVMKLLEQSDNTHIPQVVERPHWYF